MVISILDRKLDVFFWCVQNETSTSFIRLSSSYFTRYGVIFFLEHPVSHGWYCGFYTMARISGPVMDKGTVVFLTIFNFTIVWNLHTIRKISSNNCSIILKKSSLLLPFDEFFRHSSKCVTISKIRQNFQCAGWSAFDIRHNYALITRSDLTDGTQNLAEIDIARKLFGGNILQTFPPYTSTFFLSFTYSL